MITLMFILFHILRAQPHQLGLLAAAFPLLWGFSWVLITGALILKVPLALI